MHKMEKIEITELGIKRLMKGLKNCLHMDQFVLEELKRRDLRNFYIDSYTEAGYKSLVDRATNDIYIWKLTLMLGNSENNDLNKRIMEKLKHSLAERQSIVEDLVHYNVSNEQMLLDSSNFNRDYYNFLERWYARL